MTETSIARQLLDAARATLHASSYPEDVAARLALRKAVEAADRHEFKDWPEVLKRNAEAATLAKLNHEALQAIFGGPSWTDLDPLVKQSRIHELMIAAAEPERGEAYFDQAVALTREYAARVLAKITTETPYGEPL